MTNKAIVITFVIAKDNVDVKVNIPESMLELDVKATVHCLKLLADSCNKIGSVQVQGVTEQNLPAILNSHNAIGASIEMTLAESGHVEIIKDSGFNRLDTAVQGLCLKAANRNLLGTALMMVRKAEGI